jgi:hypothetical protein
MRITNDEEGWELIIDIESMNTYNQSLNSWTTLFTQQKGEKK